LKNSKIWGDQSAAVLVVIVTTIVFVGQWLIPGLTSEILFAPILFEAEPWRMFTAIFAHSTSFLPHILFNMYAVWVFGRLIEQLIGKTQFLAIYLLSGMGGSVAVLWLANPLTGVVGASGAVFGLIAATVIFYRKLGANYAPLLIILGINLVLGFMPGFNISWQAHLGGLLVGALIASLIIWTKKQRKPQLEPWVYVAVFGLLIALSLTWLFL